MLQRKCFFDSYISLELGSDVNWNFLVVVWDKQAYVSKLERHVLAPSTSNTETNAPLKLEQQITPNDHCLFSLPLPGLFFVLPCIETYQKVDLRTITLDVPPQEVDRRRWCSSSLVFHTIKYTQPQFCRHFYGLVTICPKKTLCPGEICYLHKHWYLSVFVKILKLNSFKIFIHSY